jgi:hypothetical protein
MRYVISGRKWWTPALRRERCSVAIFWGKTDECALPPATGSGR